MMQGTESSKVASCSYPLRFRKPPWQLLDKKSIVWQGVKFSIKPYTKACQLSASPEAAAQNLAASLPPPTPYSATGCCKQDTHLKLGHPLPCLQ